MTLNNTDINFFKKNGFLLIKNFLNLDEIKQYDNVFYDLQKNINNNFRSLEHKNCWEYLRNNKLLQIVKDLLGEEIYHMHDLNFVEHNISLKGGSWHRDNPCRRTGVGPDWDEKFPYNVITTITYLCDSKSTESVLNVLPKSHKKKYKYSISNLIRSFHNRNKNSKNPLQKIILNLNGKRVYYNKGDCIFFYSNLYHMGENLSSTLEATRRLIVSRFGGKGFHSENYVNYHLMHRLDQVDKYKDKNLSNEFFNFLKKNKLYFPVPNKKKEIKGSFSTI